MPYVFLIALYVGGATMLGGAMGYFIKYNNQKIDGAVFSFAAGVMLAACFAELILPETENADGFGLMLCILGIICGGGAIHLLQNLFLLLQKRMPESRLAKSARRPGLQSALLFIVALALHNLPEGIAAGIGLGTGNIAKAFTVASGIALQNVPEGMIVLPPLVRAGVQRKKAMWISCFTGVVEMAGTFLGCFAVSLSEKALPFILCFAGGTMLYIICTDVMEDANRMAGKQLSGYALLAGCCVMLIMEKYV